MNDPAQRPLSAARPVGSPQADDLEGTTGPPRARVPARAGSFDGRARSFRQEQAKRRSARIERISEFLVVAIIILGVYTIATARPSSPSSDAVFPWLPGPSGAPIFVHLGTPSQSTVTCNAGGTAYAERIPWTNSTQPVTTGDVYVEVYEIWDRDFIGDPNAVANATPSNLCAGAPPNPTALWYVVLAAPNGTNLLTYTVGEGWESVTHGPWNIWIENGSALFLVADTSLAGTGRGFAVGGYADGSPITGSLPL